MQLLGAVEGLELGRPTCCLEHTPVFDGSCKQIAAIADFQLPIADCLFVVSSQWSIGRIGCIGPIRLITNHCLLTNPQSAIDNRQRSCVSQSTVLECQRQPRLQNAVVSPQLFHAEMNFSGITRSPASICVDKSLFRALTGK
jgi:hypothetical protein